MKALEGTFNQEKALVGDDGSSAALLTMLLLSPALQTCTEQSRQSQQGTIYAGPQHSARLVVSHQAAVFLSTLLLLATFHSIAGGHCTLDKTV